MIPNKSPNENKITGLRQETTGQERETDMESDASKDEVSKSGLIEQLEAESKYLDEIEQLKRELARLTTRLYFYQCADSESINYRLCNLEEENTKLFSANEVLERQLSGINVEKTGILKIVDELADQLAKARVEVEELHKRVEANGAKIDDEDVVIAWTDYLKLKKQAHHEGWEQCYRECVRLADSGPSPVTATMIAAMDYGSQ
jgi:chromosome segregation ATPase